MTTCRAADVLADTLIAHGIDRVFCVPGESYLALLDALRDRPAIDVVVARHEGGAGFMAMADARCAGRPGVCLVSRGPGATNAAIAVHSAEQDAAPLVVIIGQVRRSDRGRGAFQEMDYGRMFGGIAKAVWEVADGARLPRAFADAFALAAAGVPGPTVLVVPEDVFEDRTAATPALPEPATPQEPADAHVSRVAALVAAAERPLIIAGGALDSTRGRLALHHAAARHSIPVALSYKRQDLFDNAHPLFAGYLGFKVPAHLVDLMRTSDLVLALGTRLGEVTTQHYRLPRVPRPEQPVVHVYPDAAPLGRLFAAALTIVADPAALLERLAALDPLGAAEPRERWARSLHDATARVAEYSPLPRTDGVEFGAVVQAVARHAARDAVVSLDGGNFGGWVHRLWPWTPANRSIGTAGGAMGMGVPGAVSAALRYRGRQVVAFVGDGGFMMTGNELATAVHRGVTLTVVVSNNRCFGTIRQQQEIAYPGRRFASDLGDVNFAAIADACGGRGFHIRTLEETDGVVCAALAARGVTLIDVDTSLQAISAYGTPGPRDLETA